MADAGPHALRDTLNVAVVGAGAFGRNHLRVYRELESAAVAGDRPVALAAVVDRDPAVVQAAATRYGVPGFASIAELLAAGPRIDAASVCVPTVHHATAAAELLTAGVDLLVEKPMAASLDEADAMLALAKAHGRVLQVGHLERFNPAVTAARAHLSRPMFFEAHRLSIFTARSLDVDVVLDLMIHDLDVVLSLVDSPVREIRAVGLPVLSRKVDIANVRLEFENGCIANFTASRISTETVRKLRFFQPHQYLSLDFARQDLLMIDVTSAAGMDPASLAAMAELMHHKGGHPTAGLSLHKVEVERGEPLLLEIAGFLQAVERRTPAEMAGRSGAGGVSGKQGRAVLAVALEINHAIAAHARRTGLALHSVEDHPA